MELDLDLKSIQEVRNLVAASKVAQKKLGKYSQPEVDEIVKTISEVCAEQAEYLARLAVEETGFGVYQDKILKNILGSEMVYNYIKDMKTVGIINEDKEKKIVDIAVPMGVIASLIPSTNPTSTVMYKSLISIKAGNAVIFSPHPKAKNCILETVKIIRQSLRAMDVPEDLVQVITIPTIEATNELMKHPDIGVILATGGPNMVKAAYSSGNPAIGVGAGNGPAFIEKSANIQLAVKRIIDSKTIDNGTICASEQFIITEQSIKSKVIEEVKKQGGYFLNEEESLKVEGVLFRGNGSMNPEVVGKPATKVAQMSGIKVPRDTKVLLSEQTKVGPKYPFSREKLCPVLGFFVEDDWKKACDRSIEILNNEGIGHTMTIHSNDESIIREFALQKPVMRLLVNTAAALGGVGATTNLPPALTLGSGAMGGSSVSDNIGPMNLINIRRLAYGVKELEDLRNEENSQAVKPNKPNYSKESGEEISAYDIEKIVLEVIGKLSKK